MSNDVVRSEENVQLIHFAFPQRSIFLNVHVIHDDVEIISPVVEFGRVGLLQRILDGQRVETESLQNREGALVRLVDKVHPEERAAISDEFGEF